MVPAPNVRTVHHFGPRLAESGGGGIASVLAFYSGLDVPGHRFAFTTTATLRTRFFSAEHVPGALRSLLAARRERPLPVIHVHLSCRGSMVREGGLLRLARRLGLPTVATVHASGFDGELRRHGPRARRVLGAAQVVHALGPATAALLRAHLGEPDTVAVVPNGVALPPEPAPAGEQDPVVVFAGQVGRRKGVDVLVAAWPAVRAAVPAARLVVLGAAEDVTVPRTPGVTVTGPVTPDRVLAALEGARVAVLPTRAEAQPVFVLEAMAAGRPVVTTDVAEIATTLGEAGAVVPAGDAPALAQALVRYLCAPHAATEAGRCGRERATAHFSRDPVSRDLAALYATALRRSGVLGSASTPSVAREAIA